MIRKIMPLLMLGLSLLLVSLLILPVFTPAYAQSAEAVISPSSIWSDVWLVVQPIVVLLVTTVGPVLVAWISARLIALLKVSDEKQRLEIEARLRDALHQSAANALRFALARAGISAGAIAPITAGIVTGDMLRQASAYVEDKNPEALQRLGVSPEALREIILSKIPEVAWSKPEASAS